jgi:hypothetical protein
MRHTADQERKYERRMRTSSILLGIAAGLGIGAFAAWVIAIWVAGDIGGKLAGTGFVFIVLAVIVGIIGGILRDDE